MRHKKENIYNKGFNIAPARPVEIQDQIEFDLGDFRKGVKKLEDASVDLGVYKKVNSQYGSKEYVLKALSKRDSDIISDVSDFWYETNGMYNRMCKLLAQMFKYDWYVVPFVKKAEGASESKILNNFAKVLDYLDDSQIKILLGDIALEVVRRGCYYGCLVDYGTFFGMQQLPKAYCRSRFKIGVKPVVELNLKFFDSYFTDINQRMKVLTMFPQDVQKAYIKYKEGKLKPSFPGDQNYWCILDHQTAFKFCIGGEDMPPLAGVIPSLIDLDSAQELDRKKTMQQLLKILIQKLPRDKNGDLIFDVEEARDLHNSAVNMLQRAVGVDVLTTFADIDVADMNDKNGSVATDALERVERTVYNNAGMAQNLFNSDGNIALSNSVLNDEASMRELVYQFKGLLNKATEKFNNNQCEFKVEILETTIYNYKDLSKTYKDQTQMGYNKLLPQIALGHSQSSILASLTFESKFLHLEQIMIPPLTSNVINADILNKNGNNKTPAEQKSAEETGSQGGRPEKPDSEKSDKTIQNRESMG